MVSHMWFPGVLVLFVVVQTDKGNEWSAKDEGNLYLASAERDEQK